MRIKFKTLGFEVTTFFDEETNEMSSCDITRDNGLKVPKKMEKLFKNEAKRRYLEHKESKGHAICLN